jgi:hypothetical protein
MDSHREKRSKKGQDVASPSSKWGRKATVICRPPPPHPAHHPSHSCEEDEEPKAFKMHSPQECTNRVALKYSKKTKQETINSACGAPTYDGSQQCIDRRFWFYLHMDWYRSIYLYKKKPMIEKKLVN